MTGDVTASWEDKGDVRIRYDNGDSPTARFSSTQDKNLVTVYSADQNIPYPAVTFSQGEKSFTSAESDASAIEVDASGKTAVADLTLQGLDDTSVDLTASFTCGKAAKGGKKKG